MSPQVSQHQAHSEPPVAHMFLFIHFPEFSPQSQHKALVESGAAGNFIDRAFAHSLGIPIVPVDMPIPVHALDSWGGHRSTGHGYAGGSQGENLFFPY